MTTVSVEPLDAALQQMPLVAILRGIRPEEVAEVGTAVREAGIGILEVPLNSPDPLRSIELLVSACGDDALIGCGTVLTERQLRDARAAGAAIVLHPHGDARLVGCAKELGMISVPGVATPTEAFAMLEAGADALKFFPTSMVTPAAFKSMKAILPPDVTTMAVGHVSAENMAEFWAAGIGGFGIGSGIYRAGFGAVEAGNRAAAMVRLVRTLMDNERGKEARA